MQRKLLGMAVACLALLPGVALAQQAAPDLEQAMAARAAGDHARAIQLLEGARLRSPNDATVLRLLGTSYAFNRQYPQAIAVLEQAHAAYPADQDIALALARAGPRGAAARQGVGQAHASTSSSLPASSACSRTAARKASARSA